MENERNDILSVLDEERIIMREAIEAYRQEYQSLDNRE